MQKNFILFILLVFTSVAKGQIFGGTPPSQKWKQIDTDTARIIFAPGMDSQASRVASVVHYMAHNIPASLGTQLRKINIVLQHQTTVPNGYVGLGPFRSEFFMTPDANSFSQGSISWTDQLALHEYRHVQQFNNFNNGISKIVKVLFGEEGYALAINASVPNWFYEGDAIYSETVLSKQGRGRLPHFLNAYPSLWQANKNYSWMKLRNGSYKDYVPNHYYLGYLLVNYGYEKYGADFWKKVTTDASAFKGVFYPFQAAIKKHAGKDYKGFVADAFAMYKKVSSDLQVNGVPLAAGQQKSKQDAVAEPAIINTVKKDYITSYYFPYAAGKDSLLYLKTSFRHRPAFYIKDKSGEHKLKVRDISLDEQYSYRNGKIVYVAYENDSRWGWRDYSVIKVLDVATKQQKTITTHTKYFTPDISADGQKVVAVENAASGKSELHILDVQNGNVLNRISSSEIKTFSDPKFINDEKLVTAVRLQDGRMALAAAEISTGNLVRLTPPSFNVVGYPSVKDGVIFFSASYLGNDDVFALKENKLYKISNGSLGNYFVNAGDGMLTWSTFTSEGYQLVQVQEKNISWQLIENASAETMATKFSVASTTNSDILLSAVPARHFASKDYKKSTRLFNFHSWRPYYEDPLFFFSLYGQNVLNTLESSLYYVYNENERVSSVGASATFGGLLPYLTLGTEYTFNRKGLIGNQTRVWDQLDSRIGLNIPLNKTKGQTFRNFNISSFYVLRNELNKGAFKDSLGNTSFGYLSHAISWGQQTERAVQHLLPKWGYSFSAAFRHAVSRFDANQFYAGGILYLPGLASTHGVSLTGAFQQRDTLRAVFSTRIANARGFSDYYRTNFGSRIVRLSANYQLPLWIPDWGFGNILYIHRFRANLFYDFQRIYSNKKTSTIDMRSAGAELFVDTRWWNQHPLSFGFRVSRLLDRDILAANAKGTMLYEFIMPVSIIPR